MSIYCPFAEALGIETTKSILDFEDCDLESGTPIIPWNKGKKGSQNNPFKGIRGRYSQETLNLISENTRKAMTNLPPEKIQRMTERNRKNGQKCWIHNRNGDHKRVNIENLNEFLSVGWERGRKLIHDPTSGKFTKHNGV